MTDHELLQAMYSDMQEMKKDMKETKQDVQSLKQDVQSLKQDVQGLRQDVDKLEQRVTCIELTLENETNRNIQLLAENFIELTKKLNQAIPVADKNLAYEVKVNHLISEVDYLKKEVAEIKSRIA